MQLNFKEDMKLKNWILRIIALVLVLMTFASLAVACNDKPSNEDPEDTTEGEKNDSGEDSDVDPDDPPVIVGDGLPEMDMMGYEFNILCRENVMFLQEAIADDGTGDQVKQAIYDRNFFVEEEYDCYITANGVTEADEGTLTRTWNLSITSGESIYKMGLAHMMYTGTEALNGTMLDLKTLPYVNMDKPYWHKSMQEAIEVNNKVYFTASDLCTSSIYYTWHMVFNMEDCDARNIDIYGMVEDGTWTIGNLWDIVSRCYVDDGDNVVEFEEDYFGFVIHENTAITNWTFALEVPVTTNPSAGQFEVLYGSDRYMKAAELIYDLLFESNNGAIIYKGKEVGATFDPENVDMKITTKFGNGDALIVATKIFALENLRTSEVKYGIVPYPKYDTDQQNYYSHVDGRASLLFVPYTLPEAETEYVGLLLEALSAATAEHVNPVIQKAALLGRYSEDSKAYQMLQDTLAGRTYAFAYVYDQASTTKPYWLYQSMMASRSDNFTDFWKSKARVADRDFKAIVKKLANLHTTKK